MPADPKSINNARLRAAHSVFSTRLTRDQHGKAMTAFRDQLPKRDAQTAAYSQKLRKAVGK